MQKSKGTQATTKPTEASSDFGATAHHPGFDPKQSFNTFVVGSCNKIAFASALAVAQAPGKSYNPLFLYGGVGLGKTHLLQAIGQHVLAGQKRARLAYVSAESFVNEYIEGVLHNGLARFHKKYRQMEVLLVDDIQFLGSAERIQEEFSHTFNALYLNQKQIVLASDRPASEIPNLEQRLVSRFEGGLVTGLQPPDRETRLAILRKKAHYMAVKLPEHILEFLADRIRSNIRRLEGALTRTAMYAALTRQPLSLQLVEGLLRDVLAEEDRSVVNIEVIKRRVAEHFHIADADMTSRRLQARVAFPRQIAMYLSRQMTDSSLTDIGDAFGARYHGTVSHACRLIKDRMDVDPEIKKVVSYLEWQLQRCAPRDAQSSGPGPGSRRTHRQP